MAVERSRAATITGLFIAAALLVVLSALTFRVQHEREVLYPSPGLTRIFSLSEINPHLAGTGGDTDVYLYESGKPGGS
jgi:hypothetical protein